MSSPSHSTSWRRAIVLWGMLLLNLTAHGQELRLDVRPMVNERNLRLNEALVELASARVTRLDFLLSGLALKKQDGSWLESRDWFAYLSAASGRMTANGTGTPEGEYTGIRFRIGVDETVNKADPHHYAADHALNPLVNGLHWGWMGGYIFMALEGRFPSGGKDDGFSYHIANAPQLMTVELPVAFRGGRPLTLALELDMTQVLAGIDFAKDGTSTHSREGDALAAKLKTNIEHAFRVRSVSYDVYQTPVFAEKPVPSPANTQPLTPAITQRFPPGETACGQSADP
jgi:hypothetical protein